MYIFSIGGRQQNIIFETLTYTDILILNVKSSVDLMKLIVYDLTKICCLVLVLIFTFYLNIHK